jgi:hypothetical protein
MCSFCVANHSNRPRHCDGLTAFGGLSPYLAAQQGLKSAQGLAQRLIASPSEENVQVRFGELQDHDKNDDDTPDETPETPPDEPQPTPIDEPPAEPKVPYVVGGRGGRPIMRVPHHE